MGLWLPPAVSRELVEGRREFEAQVHAQVQKDLGNMLETARRFNYELQRIDPRLQLVRADPRAEGTPLKAGYWHVIRDNPGAPPSIIPIEGPNGEYVEPSAQVFEYLAKCDLWDENNMRLVRQRQKLAEQAAEKRKVEERQARQEEILERWAAATRTQVSLNRDAAWSQNAAGRRGAHR